MKHWIIAGCLVFALAAHPDDTALPGVTSPDGRLQVSVGVDARGAPFYSVHRDKTALMERARLGIRFARVPGFADGFEIEAQESTARDETWTQPWGERRVVRDHHNELLVRLRRERPAARFDLRVRVFDDGFGFRYEVPGQSGYEQVSIVEELTEFHIGEGAKAWWIPGRKWNRYEYLYRTTDRDDIDRAHTPATFRLPDGVHVSLHEAALVDYAGYVLNQGRPGTFQTDLTPWSDGARVKTGAPFVTPWRTVQVTDDAVGLLNSDIILNLNEPNALGDVSWVEPGKYIGIWWAMHIRTRTWGSGERHGANTKEAMEHIDFAADNGFAGVLIEGWNIGWDGDWFNNGDVFDFTRAYPDFDLPAIGRYALERGVRLIGHHETSGNVTNYENQMEAAFDLYERHGVAQVKTGYVADAGDIKRVDENGVDHYEWHDGQYMANHFMRNILAAAERRISINTHEPIKDTGLRRTYPNWIAREGARGQEFNAWGVPPNSPEHTAILPYTRMLSGPMDFTPGIFDLIPGGPDSPSRVQTTLAKQLALYVVIYSPIQMAADLPENYKERPDAFQFIRDVPTDWEHSVAVAGEVGDFVVFARQERGGSDWYLGALTDEVARTLPVELDFLDAADYEAQIYRDGDDADWRSNPYSITIETRAVRGGQTLELPLAAGGGAAVRFIKKN